MAVQILLMSLPAVLIVLLLSREVRIYRRLQRDARRLREDRQVAELDALFELEWDWPR